MKKLFLLISIAVLCFSLAFAHNDFMKKSGNEPVPANINNLKIATNGKDNAEVPNWEWVTEPYSIMTSWYDYMPSSYEIYPLRLQHNGDGGLYYTWHAKPDDGANTNRRQYWAYINASDGTLVDWGTISTEDIWQGYGSIDTHPESGAGIATWHQEDATLGYGTTMTYDSYIFGILRDFGLRICLFHQMNPAEMNISGHMFGLVPHQVQILLEYIKQQKTIKI